MYERPAAAQILYMVYMFPVFQTTWQHYAPVYEIGMPFSHVLIGNLAFPFSFKRKREYKMDNVSGTGTVEL